MIAKPEELPDDSAGQSFLEHVDGGNKEVAPSPNMYLRYDGQLWALVAMIIGSDTTATATSGASGTMYDHTLDVTEEANGLFGTLCEYDGVSVKEVPSFAPTGFTLTGESGFLTLTIRGVGNDCLQTGAANSSGNLGSVTYKTNTLRVAFGSVKFRINDDDGAGLSNKLRINSFTLEFDRDKPSNFNANGNSIGDEFDGQEPIENSYPTCTLTVGFPRFTSTTLAEDLNMQSSVPQYKKADITIVGPTASGYGGDYSITISFPKLRITDVVQDSDGPNKIVRQLTMSGLYRSSAPTGMSGIQNILRMIVRNLTSAEYDS